MSEIYIRTVVLPLTVRGVTVVDGDGNYNVYINSRLSSDEQKQTRLHEMTHVRRGDFESFEDIDELEKGLP